MKIIIAKDYEEMSQKAFEIVGGVVKAKPDAILGLATGSTPIGLYKNMIADHKENGTSYKSIRTVNLDEYEGLDYSSDQSYVYFMRHNLFDHIDIDLKNTNIEIGSEVVTTGMSYIYPAGIYIGKVKEVNYDEYGLTPIVKIETPVDFNNILYVSVLDRW